MCAVETQNVHLVHPMNGILLPTFVLTYCEKKLFERSRNFFEIISLQPRISKCFEIASTIYSNIDNERSEQFSVTECFFNLFFEVSQIRIQIEKYY